MANVYAASSWRNEHQQEIVKTLRLAGHAVYDFKNPVPGEKGFSWSEIDPEWKQWSPEEFRDGLSHPVAQKGYQRDVNALTWCNACLLILPSGLSAHLEAGWAAGRGKPTAVYAPTIKEPELMYKLMEDSLGQVRLGWFCTSIEQVLGFFDKLDSFWGVTR